MEVDGPEDGLSTSSHQDYSSHSLGLRESFLPRADAEAVEAAYNEVMERLSVDLKHVVRSLEAVWTEVGYSDQERELQLAKLEDEVTATLRAKLSQEVEVRDVFKQDIAAKKAECEAMAAALGLGHSNSATVVLEDAAPLSTALMQLEEEQARLAEAKAARVATLAPAVDRVRRLARRLGESVSKDYLEVGDEDLAEARLDRLEAKRKEFDALQAQRVAAVAAVDNASRALERELGDDATDDQKKTQQRQRRLSLSSGGQKKEEDAEASSLSTSSSGGSSSPEEEEGPEPSLGYDAVERAEARRAALKKEKEERLAKLSELGSEISLLWERLDVPETSQRKFREMCKTSSIRRATFELGEAELAKLRAELRDRVVDLVEARRRKIRELWQEMDVPREVRSQFGPMEATDVDEEVLVAHEGLLEQLETKRANLQPILKLVERREDLLDARVKLEKIQADPGRLMRRGRGAAAERRAEMDLEAHLKTLPKLNDLLTKKISEWEPKEGPFLWKGNRYLNRLEETEANWANHLKQAKANKANAAGKENNKA